MRRRIAMLLTITILAWVVAACGGMVAENEAAAAPCTDKLGCVEIAAAAPIRIAYILALSGETAFLGQDSRGGIEIALDDRGGRLLDHAIELVGEDDLCSSEGGKIAAQKLAADPSIVGIIGTSCSSAAAAALPVISAAGLAMISSENTAPALTEPQSEAGGLWQPGYYRTAQNDRFQGQIAAEFAYHELKARTAATIHDGSPYARGLQAVFAETFTQLGGEITFAGAVNVGDTDMQPILSEVASNPAALLYLPIFEPEGKLLVTQAAEIAELHGTLLMGAEALLVKGFPAGPVPAATGMYLSGPYVTGAAYSEFLGKWQARYKSAPPAVYHAHAYDATNILLAAIEQAAQVNSDKSLLIGRQALRDVLSATTNFNGLTGVLTCNETGDCATGKALAIYQFTDAEVVNGNWPPKVVWTP